MSAPNAFSWPRAVRETVAGVAVLSWLSFGYARKDLLSSDPLGPVPIMLPMNQSFGPIRADAAMKMEIDP